MEPGRHPRHPPGQARSPARHRLSNGWRLPAESAAESVTGRWESLADLLSGKPPLVKSARAEQASALVETLSAFAQDTWSVTSRLNLTYGLRWELTPAPSMRQPSAAFPASCVPVFGVTPVLPSGPVLSPTEELWKTRYTQFAPRIGAAFRAGPRSVIRAGWGIFYDVAFSTALDPINGFPFNRWQFSAGPSGASLANAAFGFRYATDLRLPYVQQWNVAYERVLGVSNVVSASLVASSGHRLLRYEGAPEQGSTEAEFLVATNHGASTYRGLELQFKRRFTRGLQGMAAYTWSHSIDNGSSDSGVYLAGPPTSADRGSSSFDVRHNFIVGLTYELLHSGRTLPARIVAHWEVSMLLRERTGFPIDVLTTENFLGLGFDDLHRLQSCSRRTSLAPRLDPRRAQVESRGLCRAGGNAGHTGTQHHRWSRHGAGGPLHWNAASPLTESASLDLRMEAYNALNHPTPADPIRFLDNPLFGVPISTLNLMLGSGSARSGLTPAFQIGGPRTFQLQIRLRF